MKKLLTAAAVIATLSVVPATGASASSGSGSDVNIYNSQNQSYNKEKDKNSSNNSSLEAYSAKTVNYEALYYVNYSASTVDWIKQTQNSKNNDSKKVNAYNNNQNYFKTSGFGY